MDFNTLKKQRASQLEKLTDQLKKANGGEQTSNNDDRFWYPATDKAGNGFAVIRFLPAPANEDVPFIRLFEHGFKAPTGKYYIEKSLTTIGKQDPVGEYNQQLWNSTTDDSSPARKQVREQKRKLNYISNIYIVKDPANPENEGKVKLFKYGKKIFDKLNEAMNPQFADETPLNPFDLWDGANFKIKIRQVEGYRNYDKSEFDSAEPLSEDDKVLEKIWKSEHSLQEFLDPKNFKDYDTLKKKLHAVLGLEQRQHHEEEEAPQAPAPKLKAKHTTTPVEEDSVPPWDGDEEDEELSYFKKLASE